VRICDLREGDPSAKPVPELYMEGIIKEGSKDCDPGVDLCDGGWDRGLDLGDCERRDERLVGFLAGVSCGICEKPPVRLGNGVGTSFASLSSSSSKFLSSP
jgi:hypothetical protein